MTRIYLAAAAVLCSFIGIGCDDGTTQPFKPKQQDGATSTGGSGGSDSDGASSTGGSSGNSSTGGASGSTGTGGHTGDSGAACGAAFGHTGDCKTCLEQNCCTLGLACSNEPNCVKLAKCTRDCDAKGGSASQIDQCVTTCNGQYLTMVSGQVYNPVVTCMGGKCLSQCPFHGP